MFAKLQYVTGALLLTAPLIRAQSLSFPDCVNQCVDQSTDDSCQLTDVKCICRQSNGRFLPDLVTCMKAECNDALSVDELLNPMAAVCRLIGTPISDKALDNARNMDNMAPVTTTVYAATPSFTTITTEQDSQAVILVSPVTASAEEDEEGQSTVTRFPPGTTITQTQSSGSARETLIPVIVVSVDDDGNTQTATSTQTQTVTQSDNAEESSSTASEDDDTAETTSTTTSGASTITAETTATTTAGGIDSQSTDGAASTLATETSGAPSSSGAEATPAEGTLGGPFQQQPPGSGAAARGSPVAGLGLTVALFMAGLSY